MVPTLTKVKTKEISVETLDRVMKEYFNDELTAGEEEFEVYVDTLYLALIHAFLEAESDMDVFERSFPIPEAMFQELMQRYFEVSDDDFFSSVSMVKVSEDALRSVLSQAYELYQRLE